MNNINEKYITNADVKSIFSKAVDLRDKPGILGKVFKGLRKDKIDINDLQSAWKEEGYPDDTSDITSILLGHGFSKREINKVFNSVFGNDDTGETDIPHASAAIEKIAKYIKSNNLTDQVIDFMQKEYKFVPDKIVSEDLRKVFTDIVKETRSERDVLIREQDKQALGRIRK